MHDFAREFGEDVQVSVGGIGFTGRQAGNTAAQPVGNLRYDFVNGSGYYSKLGNFLLDGIGLSEIMASSKFINQTRADAVKQAAPAISGWNTESVQMAACKPKCGALRSSS
jgi:hypothetical protein